MPLNPIDKAQRRAAILERFRQESGLTRIEEGSINRALIENLMDELDNQDLSWEQELRNIFPISATSPYLEMWGEVFGINVVGPQRLQALAINQIVKIKTRSGTFGDLNGGNDITLLSDSMIIYADSSIISEGEIENAAVTYELIEDIVLSAGDSEAWISIIASGPGEGYRLDVNGITGHNFTNYLTYPDQELIVENVLPLLGGQDGTSEDSIRGSIARASLAKNSNIEDVIVREIQSLPSVDDVIVIRGFSGFNNVDVFIDTISYEIPDYIIEEAKTITDRLSTDSHKIKIHKAKRLGLALESQIVFKKGINEDRKNIILSELKADFYAFFSEQNAGVNIDFNDLYNRINQQYTEISYIGKDKNNFDKILIFRPSILGQQKYQQEYNKNFILQLERFEKIYPEVNFPNVFNLYESK